MTVTLELAPEAESCLRERAAWWGQTVTDYLLTLSELEDYKNLSLSEEEIEIVREQIADHIAAHRDISLKEFHGGMMAKIERRKQRQMAEAAV